MDRWIGNKELRNGRIFQWREEGENVDPWRKEREGIPCIGRGGSDKFCNGRIFP